MLRRLELSVRLAQLRIENFLCFGSPPTTINLDSVTTLIGPNGSGKTAALQALCRLFMADRRQRRIDTSDFHVRIDGSRSRSLAIEATFEVEILSDGGGVSLSVPDHFNHLTMLRESGPLSVRYRLSAEIGPSGDVQQALDYVLEVDSEDNPIRTLKVPEYEMSKVEIHYIPARRDPADQIAFSASSLLGKLLRAANWDQEREKFAAIAKSVSRDLLAANVGVAAVGGGLSDAWGTLHRGNYFTRPQVSFDGDGLDAVLRYLSVVFSPGHAEDRVDFRRLSDGQQSLLYLSLVLTAHRVRHDVLRGAQDGFMLGKLRPATFTLVIVEEPENSLAPYYLGRIMFALEEICSTSDAQAVLATHSPSIVKRADPTHIRHFRLGVTRCSQVSEINLPQNDIQAYKYLRQAVLAYPEVYFARVVVLGEGDSESIVLPRLLRATGLIEDDSQIVVAPLGGRHVEHFWKLLDNLSIPYVTLLDLDSGRFGGGWGRVKNILGKVLERNHGNRSTADRVIRKLPHWSDPVYVRNHPEGSLCLEWLEKAHRVFFCDPLDLDFSMLLAFPAAYSLDEVHSDDEEEAREASQELGESVLRAVLGKNHAGAAHYSTAQLDFFATYHQIFKLRSKPAAHLRALSLLSDPDLVNNSPAQLLRMVEAVRKLTACISE